MIQSIAERIERAAAFVRGQGYGTSTVRREVDLAIGLLGRPPALAIDVGANVGDYSAELRRRCPGCEIHAFEPAATNLQRLAARFRDDRGIRVVPRALSDSAGSGTLFANAPGSGLGSLSRRDLSHLDIRFDSTEPVSTMRFEQYWHESLGIRPIDILKLDFEGHELAALSGCGEALDRCTLVQFEFGGCNIDTRTFFRDFWNLLHSRGFRIYRAAPFGAVRIDRYSQRDEAFVISNYFAVRTE